MSMRDYGVSDYGLVLNWDLMQVLASQVCDNYSDGLWEENDEYGFANRWDYAETVIDFFDMVYISEFTGECFSLKADGTDNWSVESESYQDDTIFYLPVRRYPTLFRAAYNNMEDLVDEFKNVLETYLPKDFEYEKYIKHVIGTYYG